MTLLRKTPQSRSCAVTHANDKDQAVQRMPSDSAELSSCGSKERPLPQSFEPTHVQHRVSQKQRPSDWPEYAIGMNPTILAIRAKYGDITKECLLESGSMLTYVLEVICEVVRDLQKRRLTEVDGDLLDSYYLVVKDAEKLKVNVSWLRSRLNEIREAIKWIAETKKFNDERIKREEQNESEKKNLDSKKAEFEKLRSEIDIVLPML